MAGELQKLNGGATGVRSGVYQVAVAWDDDTGAWCATSSDVIGLSVEFASLDELQAQLGAVVSEKLAVNGQPPAGRIDVAASWQIQCVVDEVADRSAKGRRRRSGSGS